jgi:hypothetical protein
MIVWRRLAVSAFLFLTLAGQWSPAAAQKTPGLAPGQGGMVYGDTGEGAKRKLTPVPPQAWRYPNFGVDPAIRTDRLYQAFPQDQAVFKKGMVVSLGWQPNIEKTVTVKRYEIYVSSDNGFQQKIWVGEDRLGKPTVTLFQPPAPGRYFWQIWAFFTNDRSIASLGRTFTVLP